MHLHELSPVGRRPASGRERRRFKRFAEVGEGLTSRGRSHPGLLPLANLRFEVSRLLPAVSSEPDVAAARRALEGKLLPHPRHQLGPGNPGRVVGAGLLLRIATAFRAVTVTSMPAGYDIALLADVAARQSRDGRPQRVIGSEDAVIPVPVFPRLWNEIGEPVEELKRRELDDAVRARLRGLASLALSIRTQSLTHGLRNLKPHLLDRLGEFRTIACRNRTGRVMDEPNVKGYQLHQPHSRWFRKTGYRPIVELHVEGIPRLMSRDPSQQEVAGVACQHNSRPTLSALHVREGKLHGHNIADPRCCHRRHHRANRP